MNKKKILSFLILATAFLSLFFITGHVAQAQQSIINNSDTKYATGNYELNDFIALAIRVSRIILGIVGSLTLVMFIFSGITLLLSAGSSEKITKAKNMMVAATIGLAIVFSSYLLIKTVMSSMGLSWDGSIKKPSVTTTSTTTPTN